MKFHKSNCQSSFKPIFFFNSLEHTHTYQLSRQSNSESILYHNHMVHNIFDTVVELDALGDDILLDEDHHIWTLQQSLIHLLNTVPQTTGGQTNVP